MTGTIVNVITVIVGSLVGVIFSNKLPKRIIKLIFQSIGLFTVFLGISMAMKTQNYLVMIFSLVLGAILGEWINLDKHVDSLGNSLKRKFKSESQHFSEGLIAAFLLFCMGSMTILGAIEEGMGGTPDLLIAKSILDGFSAMALASAMGIGVLFSAIPLLLYQGGLTLLAKYAGDYFSETIVNELIAVGGIVLFAIGINILEITKIKAVNLLPGLIFAVLLAYLIIR